VIGSQLARKMGSPSSRMRWMVIVLASRQRSPRVRR
jgi:ABC-type Fe3+-siderophore transport system permease subunit